MGKLPAGTVCWAKDPTGAHPQRPVIVLSHATHPFSATDCTVMCIGTSAGKYQQTTLELEEKHLTGISFTDTSYLMPWALYTIPPGTLMNGTAGGELTEEGRKLVKKSLISLLP
jgi:hypothetical protein